MAYLYVKDYVVGPAGRVFHELQWNLTCGTPRRSRKVTIDDERESGPYANVRHGDRTGERSRRLASVLSGLCLDPHASSSTLGCPRKATGV